MRKKILFAVLAAIVLFGLIQLVPFGRNHTNPPVVDEIAWDSPETRALAQRACFDCHSNETIWPWYSNVAPMSWLVARDVMAGREEMNFSDWGTSSKRVREIVRQIEEGKMPPKFYLPMHPPARLSAADKTQLIDGFRKTVTD